MSEQENSGFASEGYESFPALHHDSERIHEVTQWPQEMLDQRLREYAQFLGREALMPRARATAERLNTHMMFELEQREDHDDQLTEHDLEQLLEVS